MKLTQIKPAELRLLETRKFGMDEVPKIFSVRPMELKSLENR